MTTIRAHVYGGRSEVTATGITLAAAVRSAVRLLGVGPGRTVSRQMNANGEWDWDWSGTHLVVREIAPVSGKRIVSVTLSLDAIARIDTLAHERGLSRSACVEAIVMATPTEPSP